MANVSHLLDAVAKLRWSANEGDWSATLTPEECTALLAVIPESEVVIKSLGVSDIRVTDKLINKKTGEEFTITAEPSDGG